MGFKTRFFIKGFTENLRENQRRWINTLRVPWSAEPLKILPPKIFVSKVGLPRLSRYGQHDPGEAYWSRWPTNHLDVGKSRIDGDKVQDMAIETGFRDEVILSKVYLDLKEGARIGCRGSFQEPSVSNNVAMSLQVGEQVSDAIVEWAREGYKRGPVEKKTFQRQKKCLAS